MIVKIPFALKQILSKSSQSPNTDKAISVAIIIVMSLKLEHEDTQGFPWSLNLVPRLLRLLRQRAIAWRDHPQPRPQGLLAFQNGGGSGEDPGMANMAHSRSRVSNEDGEVFKMAATAKRVRRTGYEMLR